MTTSKTTNILEFKKPEEAKQTSDVDDVYDEELHSYPVEVETLSVDRMDFNAIIEVYLKMTGVLSSSGELIEVYGIDLDGIDSEFIEFDITYVDPFKALMNDVGEILGPELQKEFKEKIEELINKQENLIDE